MAIIHKLEPNPVLKANIFSRIFFWWLNSFFWKGGRQELEINDMYHVVPNDESKSLGDRLGKIWHAELAHADQKNQNITSVNEEGGKKKFVPSLTRAIVKLFWVDCTLVSLLALIEECFTRIAQPMLLGYLIRYFSTPGSFSVLEGYLFATGIVITAILYTFTHHPFFFGVCHIGMRIRVACCSLVYRKALRLSQVSLGQTTIGQMVNLLSNDVNRFEQCTVFLPYLVVGPLQTAIITAILWQYFGVSCLAGLLVLILFVPFQGYMGRLFSNMRTSTASRTDKRIRIMNEIVTGMQVIKYYTWEKPFSDLVAEAREDEVKIIRKTSLLRAVNMSLFYTSSKVIIFLTLLTYVLLGEMLTAEKVFVTLSLYNNVRLLMTLFFPNAIAQLAEALVSVKRLQEFLLLQEREKPTPPPPANNRTNSNSEKQSSIAIEKFSAKWNSEYEENTLDDISVSVADGELVTVIGPVGAGKSSLLYALLNELPAINGNVKINGSIAYASQEPWVYSGSVRDNILFGKEYDSQWYDQVIEACALKRDLKLLPYGDNSLVGDRGTSLSGGQKARINLARAVYANSDIYLLDDPLSAVDASVSRHLYDKCINGILKGKIRILITHQLQYLKNQSHIILLNNGKIEIAGTFEQLQKSGIDFTELLKSSDTPNENNSASSFGRSSFRGSKNKLSSSIQGSPFANSQNNISALTQPQSVVFKPLSSVQRVRTTSQSSIASLTLTHQESIALGENSLLGNIYSHDIVHSNEDYFDDALEGLQSKQSIGKVRSSEKGGDLEDVKFIPKEQEEHRAKGTIKMSIYWKYFHAGGGICCLIMLLLANVVTQILFTGSDYFLNFWTTAEENKHDNTSTLNKDDPFYELKNNRDLQIIMYSSIVGGLFLMSMFRSVLFFNISMNSSVNLHQQMFHGIMHAPMKFFETNPVGRIFNRISSDIGQIDNMLPAALADVIEILLNVLGILIVIAIVNPILLIPTAILSVLFYYLRRFYLKTARSIKRLEGISRSPVFSHLSTTLYGLCTIRAFRTELEFMEQFDDLQDLHSASWYLFISTTRWFGIRLDWISTVFIAAVTFSFMIGDRSGHAAAAEVGLAIASALTLSGMFQWGVRQSAEVENQMVSVERVMEYTKLESEASLESSPACRPPTTWPSSGEIILNHMFLQYGDNPPVLNDITCSFHGGEKVGIVGRTGAGKSSLITALFRLAEPTGEIIIDGINIQNIGLHDLRGKIAIIPQDPVLFTGTLRKNLDPFNNYTDVDIWNVLEQIHLAEDVRQVPAGIDVEISEGGSNFSVGQRQLVCLGRAILRKNKILVLDEATANVDPVTDSLIQTTIRKKFADCTVLTIAHRLNTVMDSDRILVLDAGRIKEFDIPFQLLQDRNSALSALVKETGKHSEDSLRQISKMSAEDKKSNLSKSTN